MIPQNKNQPGPPGVVQIWGHPWHGLVEDGTLTLPNSDTMIYPIPSSAGEADVLAFQPPGTPPVVRSPEQAAADAAAGRQWLDYALICGRNDRRLYGQSIGGNGTWLYAAPDGSRWRVTLGGVLGNRDLTVPLVATVTCIRFGAFGAPEEEHDLPITLADWQQDVPGKPGGDWFIYNQGDVTSAKVSVEDVDRTGSRAIMMIGLDFPLQEILRRSLGFLLVELTGTPGAGGSATLSVLRSRAETLGTIVSTEEGSFEQHHLPPTDTYEIFIWSGSGAYSADLIGRVIAMAFDAGGTPLPLEFSGHNVTTTVSGPPSGETPPLTWEGSVVSAADMTLSWGGSSISLDVITTQGFGTTFSLLEVIETTTATSVTPLGTYALSGSDSHPLSGPQLAGFSEPDRTVLVGFPVAPVVTNSDGFIADLGSLGGASNTIAFSMQRSSSRLVDLIVLDLDLPQRHYFASFAPDSADTSVLVFDSPRPYGSVHPVTGEIARARDVPVCWV